MKFRISEHDEVTSTNDIVKEAIEAGEPEGFVAVARTQTAGYGRRGNKWISERGSLFLSILLRPGKPADELQTISLMSAMAVRRAIAAFLPEEARESVRIKWPNDVVVMSEGDGKARFNKICGISVEQKHGAVCVGIGINVSRERACPEEAGEGCCDDGAAEKDARAGRNRPTFLCELLPEGECPMVEEVQGELLCQLEDVYQAWLARTFDVLRDEFMRHFALEGFKIRIDDTGDEEPVRCKVEGITPDGRLLVKPDGEEGLREISSGTVTVIA